MFWIVEHQVSHKFHQLSTMKTWEYLQTSKLQIIIFYEWMNEWGCVQLYLKLGVQLKLIIIFLF